MIRRRLVLLFIFLCHAILLLHAAERHSIVVDETGHLPAGLSHWELRRFEAYAVNPPLIRSWAAIPLCFSRLHMDWREFDPQLRGRSEFPLGRTLIALNPERFHEMLTRARRICVVFSLIGLLVCYAWSRELWGYRAGFMAASMWCFSPTILGHAALMTPDAHAAAIGLASAYLFWKWLKRPSWWLTILSGVVLGLAQLTKFTWIVLYLIFPVCWMAFALLQKSNERRWWDGMCQLTVQISISIYLINVGYLFEGTGERLGEFEFCSAALTGIEEKERNGGPVVYQSGNRFRNSVLHDFPVLLPKNFVLGIDHQQTEFSGRHRSYLRGQWRGRGWWYYYIYAMAIKVPAGFLSLFMISVLTLARQTRSGDECASLIVVCLPAIAVIGLVSAQTGFNHHLRYILPGLPFLFVLSSSSARLLQHSIGFIRLLPVVCLAWGIVSSLFLYPHSLSYFNEFVGGPENGWKHLNNSNVDWGQDLIFLKEWRDDHPDSEVLRVFHHNLVSPAIYGINCHVFPNSAQFLNKKGSLAPGWYAVSLHAMVGEDPDLSVFQSLEPTDRVGYSMRLFHVPDR